MERLFSLVVSQPPGASDGVPPVANPALMMLRNQHKSDAALVQAVIKRLAVDDENSSVQTLGFLVTLAVEKKIPPKELDDLLMALVEFGLHHGQWPDTLKWLCAFVHHCCTDELTIAQLEECDAMEVAAAAISHFPTREDVVLAASTLLTHFTCCNFKPSTLTALRVALQNHPGHEPICRNVIKTLTHATTTWSPSVDIAPLVDAYVGADAAGVNALLAVLHKSMTSRAGTKATVRALANLAATSRDAARASVVATVLDALLVYGSGENDEEMISAALLYIANGAAQQDVQASKALETVLPMLQQAMVRARDGHLRVLTDVIHTLGALATHWKESKTRMAAAGVADTLLVILKDFSGDAVLQQQSCNLLSYLCFDSENITNSVTRSGGVKLVLAAMGNFRTNEHLLTAACAAISGLTFNNPAGQDVVRQESAVPLLLDILKKATRPRLVEMACLALGTLCWNVELKTAIAEAKGIDLVVGALEKYSTTSGVVKNACRALAQIAFNSEKYRDEMTQRGAIRLIIQGMSNHPQHDRAQLHACAALSYLSWTSPANAADILQHDGYKAIVRAMSHNLPNHEVQEHACRALANINGAPAAETDAALQAIVDAMVRHERIAEVQEEACRAIVTLALAAPENKTKLHQRNVSVSVVAALKRFPNIQLVQQEAANAIAHLAYEHQELNTAITELEAVALLIAAMRNFPTNSKLQLNACGGLSALAFNNQVAQRQVSDQGGVSFILRAMKDFDRVRILELGCSLLGTLAWNPQIKEKVAEACVPTIITTMRNYPDNACLQKATIRAAAQFAFDSEKNRVLLFEADAVTLILKALKDHMSNSKLVSHALVALTYLCWENGTIASAIMDSEALNVVEKVMEVHGNCERVSGRAHHLRRILQRRTTPTGADAPPFPVNSPVLPYGNRSGIGFSVSSPPGSPVIPRTRGGRASGSAFDKPQHSPMVGRAGQSFSVSFSNNNNNSHNPNQSTSPSNSARGGRSGGYGSNSSTPTNAARGGRGGQHGGQGSGGNRGGGASAGRAGRAGRAAPSSN